MDHARLLESDCEILPIEHRGRPGLFIRNRRQASDAGISLPRELAIVLPLIDGRRTLDEITRAVDGLSREIVEEIVLALDGIYLIDNERSRAKRQTTIQAFKQATVREPICAGGVYSKDPTALGRQIDSMYTLPGGPGLPSRFEPNRPTPRLVLSPHIDYRRGKHSFTWGFKEIAERSTATIYVIIRSLDSSSPPKIFAPRLAWCRRIAISSTCSPILTGQNVSTTSTLINPSTRSNWNSLSFNMP